jgi:hypothetical protein
LVANLEAYIKGTQQETGGDLNIFPADERYRIVLLNFT